MLDGENFTRLTSHDGLGFYHTTSIPIGTKCIGYTRAEGGKKRGSVELFTATKNIDSFFHLKLALPWYLVFERSLPVASVLFHRGSARVGASSKGLTKRTAAMTRYLITQYWANTEWLSPDAVCAGMKGPFPSYKDRQTSSQVLTFITTLAKLKKAHKLTSEAGMLLLPEVVKMLAQNQVVDDEEEEDDQDG